jgi:hypothetical protein
MTSKVPKKGHMCSMILDDESQASFITGIISAVHQDKGGEPWVEVSFGAVEHEPFRFTFSQLNHSHFTIEERKRNPVSHRSPSEWTVLLVVKPPVPKQEAA